MASKLVLYGLIGGLVCSAVLNAVLLGNATRRAVEPPPAAATAEPGQSNRAVSAEVQAAWAKLPETDRRELWNQFGDLRRATAGDYQRLEDLGRQVAQIAARDPFDEAELRDSVIVYRHIQAGLQQGVDDTLIMHLSKMPADARETAARGLLTPFYQWMRPRRDGQPSAARSGRPDADASRGPATPAATNAVRTPGGGR
jgi:uncharacterized membrane protein